MVEALTAVMKVMDEAREAGLIAQFQLGQDWQGKTVIQMVGIAKNF